MDLIYITHLKKVSYAAPTVNGQAVATSLKEGGFSLSTKGSLSEGAVGVADWGSGFRTILK